MRGETRPGRGTGAAGRAGRGGVASEGRPAWAASISARTSGSRRHPRRPVIVQHSGPWPRPGRRDRRLAPRTPPVAPSCRAAGRWPRRGGGPASRGRRRARTGPRPARPGRRAQGQGSGHLAGEQGARLQTEDAVGALLLIGRADVEDQFGAAVRRDALHRRPGRRRGVGPEGSDEGTQGRGRCVLLIPLPPAPTVMAQLTLAGSGGRGAAGAQGTPSSLSFFTSAGVASP
jgi:hypothetical protein